MKKLYTLTLTVFMLQFSIFKCSAQWVTIPDANFVTYLQTTFPSCMNGNQMDTTCAAIVNEDSVTCAARHINILDGIQYFDSLKYLNCGDNIITVIPGLPAHLVTLNCSANWLDSLPQLPGTLKYLETTSTAQLTFLPSLPAGLTYLRCTLNALTGLPPLPDSLTYLNVSSNYITGLPALPNGLTYLNCYNNQLTSLPALPDGLITLECSMNQLSSIPALPNGLARLYCNENQLTVLPVFPNGLHILGCGSNQLSVIPTLPTQLEGLACENNQLTTLPILPNSLVSLYCIGNQLTSLPELPDSLSYCYVGNNPLSCLPQLKRIVELDFSGTNVICLPNYPQSNVLSNPPLDSLPLCDIYNVNGCATFSNISGKVFYDSNADCIADSSDSGLINIPVSLWSNGTFVQQAHTLRGGVYSFETDTGAYQVNIDTASFPFYVVCPNNGMYNDTITNTDSIHYDRNFGLGCKPGFDLIARSISADLFRPARFTKVDIHAGDLSNFYGAHCASGVSGQVTTTISGPASFVSSAPGALSPGASANVLTYTIADFGVVNFNADFNIIVQTDTSAPVGSQVCFTVSVTPTAGDNDPANNTLTHCFTVVSSYDPNNKEFYPSGDIDTAQRWLTYTVNFQNTGTDTARQIYVTDTLDSDVDPASFQLLAYSHQPMVQIKQNTVRFNFPNINLVDSGTNEPLSHGYVQYKVKIKDNKPIGTVINNTAFIYFDFNAPVVTNTTTNTIAVVNGIGDTGHKTQDLRVYPNPATNTLIISAGGEKVEQVLIYDLAGKLVSTVNQPANNRLDISALSSGAYIAEVKVGEELRRARWVKM